MSVVDLLLRTAYEDTQLLIKNDSLGDKFGTPRDVEFLLIANDEKKANTVCSFINDNRYGEASVGPIEGEFRVSVVINMPIEQNVVCSVSGLMACISKIFDVEYDGWGCEIKR